ncbi:hypothetical protein Salat_2929800 [Sesamum alatum]|uniref:Uncharacterized protein n=1 Tax=Sesamum alatum TaxID=300844 RepID=A0AAE1XJ71_9LAMI|nr:hypothetical protein Salat_2929800 [Sesamum alatum]
MKKTSQNSNRSCIPPPIESRKCSQVWRNPGAALCEQFLVLQAGFLCFPATLQPTGGCPLAVVVGLPFWPLQAAMAKTKKHKVPAEATTASGQTPFIRALVASPVKAPAVGHHVSVKVPTAAHPTAGPVSVKETAMPNDITKVGSMDFHAFISDLEASPCYSANPAHVGDTSGTRSAAALRARKPLLKPWLESNDLINVKTKLGFCLVGYIADKFPGLKAIRALA